MTDFNCENIDLLSYSEYTNEEEYYNEKALLLDDIYKDSNTNMQSSTLPTTKKRGRKKNEEKKNLNLLSIKRYHKNKDKDNIIGKIKTHFKRFVIALLSLIVREKYKRQKVIFRNFNHKGSDISSMRDFMEMTIKQVCDLPISSKFHNFSSYQNQKSLKEISDNKIINSKLKDIYTNLYLSNSVYSNYLFEYYVSKKKKLMIKNFNDLINDTQEKEVKSQLTKFGKTLVSDYITQQPKSDKSKNNTQSYEGDNNIIYQDLNQ